MLLRVCNMKQMCGSGKTTSDAHYILGRCKCRIFVLAGKAKQNSGIFQRRRRASCALLVRRALVCSKSGVFLKLQSMCSCMFVARRAYVFLARCALVCARHAFVHSDRRDFAC